MKVMVTGASGYLGGHLCAALLKEGYTVRAFVRRSSDLSHLPTPRPAGGATSDSAGGELELAFGDVTDLPSLQEACAGCEVLVHSAAIVESWIPDLSQFHSVNVGGLENVLEAYRRTETLQKIIYTSSFFALGPTNGQVADENQVHPEKSFCTEYEKSKTSADKIAHQAALEGIPIVIMCPGVIYGPGKITGGNTIANLLIERFNGRLPGYIGDSKDKFSFSHVEDVAAGHVAAIRKGRIGQKYLLAGENGSLNLTCDLAAAITKTRKPTVHIPLWLLYIYGWLSVIYARLTGKPPTISYPAVKVVRRQWAYSNAKAREDLGYSPRPLDEGMEEVLPWLKGLGLIKY
ncbi:unnamed protein product [Spirodela intermedia]|uniref:NAD-dependent epimerase/dehydratase domain-containing protein n=1 Tax=Spirodela intermedia TaxID=51605 RepID=A0A7I8KDB3_SPIIN|nr:unnamed protein product [Spirodela intermedia]